jgi:hypothetical protein
MENQVAALLHTKNQMSKVNNSNDYTHYKIGLFTFIVFVLAISTLIIVNFAAMLP